MRSVKNHALIRTSFHLEHIESRFGHTVLSIPVLPGFQVIPTEGDNNIHPGPSPTDGDERVSFWADSYFSGYAFQDSSIFYFSA